MLHLLIHSSKTMTRPTESPVPLDSPLFIDEAIGLVTTWRALDSSALQRLMKISAKKAVEVANLYANWTPSPTQQTSAIDTFRGDIYSGLQVSTWSDDDRRYAHHSLTILSGLYGALRACDGIMPYRLEMGYKLPDGHSLDTHWGAKLPSCLPPSTTHILNLSAVEYTKALLPFTDLPVITPKFLTISPKSGQPIFVAVHTKIARGAFANWVVRHRLTETADLPSFCDIGYTYDHTLSTATEPVYVCEIFQGIGLSVRS